MYGFAVILRFLFLAKSKVILGLLLASESWWLYSAALPAEQAGGIITWFLTKSYYPATEVTSPTLILVMSSVWLGSNAYPFCKSLVWIGSDSNFWPSTWEAFILTDLAAASGHKPSSIDNT